MHISLIMDRTLGLRNLMFCVEPCWICIDYKIQGSRPIYGNVYEKLSCPQHQVTNKEYLFQKNTLVYIYAETYVAG